MNEEEFRSILQRLRQNDAFDDGTLDLRSFLFFFFQSKEFKPDKFLQDEGLIKEQVVELCDALKVNNSLQSIELGSNYFVLLILFCCFCLIVLNSSILSLFAANQIEMMENLLWQMLQQFIQSIFGECFVLLSEF
jgi:hypothetical protein